MRKRQSLSAAYFETLYQGDKDPWKFATSEYEAQKYARTMDVVGHEPVQSALEVGCSIGVLTAQLAQHCRDVVATEVSPIALEQARRRCAKCPNVQFRLARSTSDALGGPYDLIMLSEIVYFWDDEDLGNFATRLEAALSPGGRVILVHWLGETDYPKSADDAVAALLKELKINLKIDVMERTADYRLDVWRRAE